MREAANRLGETMKGLSWREPELPVVQNVDAEVHDVLQSIRDALVRQLYLPVQWTGVVQALASTGIMRLGACVPGKVITGLARGIEHSINAPATGGPSSRCERKEVARGDTIGGGIL